MPLDEEVADDPVAHVARWRPRAENVECRRANGAVETYPVGPGRRAWDRLRSILPPDAVELVGRGPKGVIVGRWVAPAHDEDDDQDHEAQVADHVEEAALARALADPNPPPTREAALMRWTMREMRVVYRDQSQGFAAALKAMAEVLAAQRDHLTAPTPAFAAGSDEQDNDTFAKLTMLLAQAGSLLAAQRAAAAPSAPHAPNPPSSPPPPPPGLRDSSSTPKATHRKATE